MDEHTSPEAASLVDLIDEVLQGTASDEQKQQLQDRLLANVEDRRVYLHRLNLHSALGRQFAYDVAGETSAPLGLASSGVIAENTRPCRTTRLVKWAWPAVMAAVVMLIATGYFLRPRTERPIATITGMSGSLRWTGDGGRVNYDLSVGAELSGGTAEGMTPGSWLELKFNDGSTVTISGNSILTFSDHGQKVLYLKDGNLSCNAKPQPAGQPMLIYTRSAMLEILGTRFEVEAGLAATTLNVSEGNVRVRRFSDGRSVDVPAKHRMIAAADREMQPLPVPDSVGRWKSQLHLGPDRAQGKWSPKTDAREAKLAAIPYTTPEGKTIYTAGFGVSCGDKPPVILQPASRIRVRGRMALSDKVYFGVTVRSAGGEFAGRFQTIRPALQFPSGKDFEVVLDLQDFQLDPSLDAMKNKLPRVPFGLVVESFWCHTLDKPSGLELVELELIPPTDNQGQ